jgi:pimeloyl-ACP methyl ester carboxylesterase
MDEIAAAVIDGMDALGLDEVDLYGGHTSAMTAIELGIARPRQVKHAILNGVTMFTDEQLVEKRTVYFQPLRISDDGAYLVWCWHYLRDMWLWYPWHDHRGDHLRPDWSIQDPVSQQARLGDFLKCGLTYISAYRAAVDYPSRTRLPLLKVPTLLCAASDDTLRGALPEAASLVPHAIALETPGKDTPDARGATDALFRHYLDDEPLGAGTPI